jgi:multidrug resistance efflux pump
MVKVRRENPSQRRHHRVTAPLSVTIAGGETYTTADWSLGGLCVSDMPAPYPDLDSEVPLSLDLPFQGFDIAFEVTGRVVRCDADTQEIAFEFVDLPERARDLMNHFIEDLIRGKMATVEDAICRIDVPITPISTQPDPNPQKGTKIRRWPIKTMVMTSLYLVVGFVTFSYLGVLLYSNMFRMEVQSAVVSAPIQTINMPIDGIVRPIRFEAGMRVSRGEEIARIENPALASRLSDARVRFDGAKDALWRAEQRARIEEERMRLYRIVNRTDRDIALARIESSWEALKAADANLERVRFLAEKRLATNAKLEEAESRQAKADAMLQEAQLELERSTAMDSVSERRHYNHKEFVTDLDMVALDVSAARSAFEAAATKLHTLQAMQTNQVIRAPFDGRIVALFQPGNVNVRRDQPLLTMEEERNVTVTAFLDQAEILKVGLNDDAKVFLPALNQHVRARVISIDRNSVHLRPDADHYTWRDSADRTATVSLQVFVDHARMPDIRAGLPAVVIFKRRTSNDIFARIPGVAGSPETVDEQRI